MYKIAAYLVVVAHSFFIIFFLLSLPLAIVFEYSRVPILIVTFSTIVIWYLVGNCPLTTLEKKLWLKSIPENHYEEDFVPHYSKKFFGHEIKGSTADFVAKLIVVMHIVIYIFL